MSGGVEMSDSAEKNIMMANVRGWRMPEGVAIPGGPQGFFFLCAIFGTKTCSNCPG